MTPLRSEHVGSIAIIIILHILQMVTKVDLDVEIWVDNAEVMRRVTATDVSPVALDYDLFRTTRQWLKKISYSLKWSKVDSHIQEKLRVVQTRVLNGNQKAWRLNERVDQYAEKMCASMTQPGKEVFYSASGAMISIEGTWIYESLYQQLIEAVHKDHISEYLCGRFGWSREQFDTIDWEAMEVYTKNLNPCKETNVIKMVTNWQNNNHQNSLFYSHRDNICPACELTSEEHMHFLSCSDPVL